MITTTYPVGSHVVIRDAEWRVLEVGMSAHAGDRLKCVGVSEIVRGRVSLFYTEYEDRIELLTPEATRLVEDRSPGFQKSKLFIEALLRATPKTDPKRIVAADRAAMDPMPYQFDPALQALSQPRARILIADAVGIGKTLEAGILTSELIARGRGRRILVLTTKAMLEQFQQEFWNRFSIPLVRLDSTGLARVRARIPSSHNPFHYFDRSIISIDTLKNDTEYRDYLEHAYWDIIIIDEAHNVAERGSSSLRAKLAKLLASRSDTMIMLSATPHDGRAESFASLMNMLDPTAIANPKDYRLEDFSSKGLVIRRFKSDVHDQVSGTFPDRQISVVRVAASAEENAVLDYLAGVRFDTLDAKESRGAQLFATTLTKAFFSSPAACEAVIVHRLERLRASKKPALVANDIAKLEALLVLVKHVGPEAFSKLGRLAEMLGQGNAASIGWNKNDPKDRLVIFTESIETLDFLAQELPKRAQLKSREVKVLKGSMRDTEIAEVVNEFNRVDSPVRLLLCSDVASEGINLHHFAHRMVHFDIPWSLLTFQQRNGRIDRYGQTEVPEIWYMQTTGASEKSLGDARVLELLAEKDRRAQENLSDPAEFMLSAEEQEDRTAQQIEGRDVASFDAEGDDFFSLFDAATAEEEGSARPKAIAPVLSHKQYEAAVYRPRTLFPDEMHFAKAVLRYMNSEGIYDRNQLDLSDEHRILLGMNRELEARCKYLPAELLPEDNRFDLTDDINVVKEEMKRARAAGDKWPHQSMLTPLHPVMNWLEDHALGLFGRHTAPVLHLPGVPAGERWVLMQGGYPNHRGFIPIHRWVVVHEKDGELSVKSFFDLMAALSLDMDLSNLLPSSDEDVVVSANYAPLLKRAIVLAEQTLSQAKRDYEAVARPKLEAGLAELAALKQKHFEQLAKDLEGQLAGVQQKRRQARSEEIERRFDAAQRFLEYAVDTEDTAYIQLVAIFDSPKR